jgi:hypothetical protein
MLTLLIFTNKYVRKFLNKKAKQEIKVVPSEMSIHDFLALHLENVASTPRPIIELNTRILTAIGEGQKIPENGGFENEVANVANLEKLKKYIMEQNNEDGKLPAEKIIEKDLNLTRRQQQLLKNKLEQDGFIYKDNGRYRVNVKVEV